MADVHRHKCDGQSCGIVWEHDGDAIPAGRRREAHTCPRCGRISADTWDRYDGPQVPAALTTVERLHAEGRSVA